MRKTVTNSINRGPAASYWARLLFILLLSAFGSRLYAYDLTVAKDGTGNYTTVQAAITAAPTGRTTAYTIFIKDGVYAEKISVPSNKPFLQLVGQSVANTILTWNDNALTPNGAGGTLGTGGSGSFTVNAPDFSALNITFVNSFGDGSQAVAVSLYGDRAAFKNCRFLGNQDTLLTYGTAARQYFKDCYIDGNVDFIFGNAVAIFDNCTIYAKSRSTSGVSYITAANTPAGQTYGYLFRNATIPSNTGGTLYYLGRPWQNSTGFSTAAGTLSNPKVIFMKTRMGYNQIQPAGWVIWDAGTDVSKITYGEYRPRYFSGNNVNVSQRVSWSQQMTPADTLQYTTANMFGSWNPCNVATGFCTTTNPPDIAVSNFRATKGTSQTTLNWNISWAMTGIRYDLLRSSDNLTFSQINTVTATNDSTYNFQMTDALPAAGTAYYYKLQASKAGLATHTVTAVVSSVPTITTNGTLGAFTQYQGTPSAVQTYTVSGANMTDNLTITAPAGFEISTNGGTSWSGSGTPIVLTATANTVATTTVSVRLNAATAGAYSGNIAHTSNGAATVNVAVTGSRVTTQADPTVVLEQWPLTADAVPTIVAAGVTASSPTLSSLNLLDGSTAAGSIPGYSTRGQAIAPLATGGGWTSGTLSRTGPYEEFTVVADATHTLRVDSLVFSSAFYNSLNGRLGVSYSLTAPFAPTEVTGGVLPDGGDYQSSNTAPLTPVPQPAGATGGFTTVAANATLIPRRNNGPLLNTNTYRLALNSSTGVTVAPGQTLTLRMYFALGSSSTPRPAFLLQVSAKGTSTAACNAAFTYPAATYCSNGTNPTPTVTGTAGGTFASTTGLSLNATTGAINLATSTAGTYTVTYNATASCNSTATVTISAAPTANIGYPATSYCTTTTGTVALGIGTGSTRGTITVSPTTGLTIDAAGTITPSTSTPGTYFITNTVAASGSCAAVTGGTTVTLTAPTPAGISYGATSYCTSASAAVPVVLASGASAGTFSSTAGLTINATTGAITPSTSTPGTYTVTNTVAAAGGCAATSGTATVTIVAPAVASFTYPNASYCPTTGGAATPTLGTGSTAGTFTSTTGLVINAATGAISLGTSTPGTYTVTNTIGAAGGCAAVTATSTVTVNPAAIANAGPAVSICSGSSATLGVAPVAGTIYSYSPSVGLSNSSISNPTVTLTNTASAPITQVYTLTATTASGCTATATVTVTVNPAAVATFTYPAASYCASQTTAVAPTLGTGSTAGAFSSTTGLTINATTGAITPSTSTAGTYLVTNQVTTAAGCVASATFSVTITPTPVRPTVTAAYNGATTTLTSSAATGNQWYFNGTIITGATGQTYVVNGTAAQLGSYTVVTTSAQGCASLPSLPLVVTSSRSALPGTSLNVFPNPSPDGNLTVELVGYRQAVTVTLFNAVGQLVLTRQVATPAAGTAQQVELAGLAPGVYVLRAATAGGVDTRRIVTGR
ncbi:MAG: hypothetical protein JWR44_3661 [Hymenobacter sp.]|nr:hypothetical protein [Hymenobacter sp.]